MAFVIAMVATALVGAVIALPALRLRGLYLALATAAFSLAVEQMLFKEYTVARRIYPATLILLVAVGLGAVYRAASSRYRVRGAVVAGVVTVIVIALAATQLVVADTSAGARSSRTATCRCRGRSCSASTSTRRTTSCCSSTVVFAILGVADDRVAAQRLRAPAHRDEEQSGRVRDARHERRAAQALGVHDLGRDRGSRRLPVRAGDRRGHERPVQSVRVDDDADAARRRGRGLRVGRPRPRVCSTARCSSRSRTSSPSSGADFTAFQGLTAWLVHFTALLPALIGIGARPQPERLSRRRVRTVRR